MCLHKAAQKLFLKLVYVSLFEHALCETYSLKPGQKHFDDSSWIVTSLPRTFQITAMTSAKYDALAGT